MVLNLSPLAAHLGESLCSLRFATKVSYTVVDLKTLRLTVIIKVNNTTIGTAKRQARGTSN